MQTVPGRKKLTLLGQDFSPKPGSVIKKHKLNLCSVMKQSLHYNVEMQNEKSLQLTIHEKILKTSVLCICISGKMLSTVSVSFNQYFFLCHNLQYYYLHSAKQTCTCHDQK